MKTKNESVKSRQRLRVMDAYRGRGRRNNPLWLVYSEKTKRDWIFSSDRQLVHWLAMLEFNSQVQAFEILSDKSLSGDFGAVDVTMKIGAIERHFVLSGFATDESRARLLEKHSPQGNGGPICHVFCDTELTRVMPFALRCHKALSFAAGIRDQELSALRVTIVQQLKTESAGTVADLTCSLPEREIPLALGLLVRLTIEGYVELDLTKSGFCYKTPWRYREGGGYAIA